MKPSKPVRLKPKNKNFHYEVHAVAKECGLIAECDDYPEIMYWNDSKTGRRFRVLESMELQVSDDSFDRWANSGLTSIRMPDTDEKLRVAIDILRYAK